MAVAVSRDRTKAVERIESVFLRGRMDEVLMETRERSECAGRAPGNQHNVDKQQITLIHWQVAGLGFH
jgi:hypothetical protein